MANLTEKPAPASTQGLAQKPRWFWAGAYWAIGLIALIGALLSQWTIINPDSLSFWGAHAASPSAFFSMFAIAVLAGSVVIRNTGNVELGVVLVGVIATAVPIVFAGRFDFFGYLFASLLWVVVVVIEVLNAWPKPSPPANV
jgi:hypothetical protein